MTLEPRPTLILALESSGDTGGACVLRGSEVLAEVLTPGLRGHGAHLVPCSDQALRACGVALSEVQMIVINAGPGSYTGLRIGLASAEAAALALKLPVRGIGCFEVMMEEAGRCGLLDGASVACPMLDARQDHVMFARFVYDQDTWRRSGPEELAKPEAFGNIDGLLFGDGVTAYQTRFGEGCRLNTADLNLRPSSLGLASLRLGTASHGLDGIDRQGRVALRYFRPVLAKTVAQRQAEAESRAALRQHARQIRKAAP